MFWPATSFTGVSGHVDNAGVVDDEVDSTQDPTHTVWFSIPQLSSVNLTRCHIGSGAARER
jgi:hypothetical protein